MNGKRLAPDRFVVLIARHERRVRAFISTLVACETEVVDEILQAAYLVAWQKLETFSHCGVDPDEELIRWICAIARFEVMSYLRKKRSAPVVFDETLVERIAECHENMGDVLEQRHEALKACVQRLPPRQRELLGMRYWQGLSVKEVALRRNQSDRSIYSALSRIRKMLERCILQTLKQEGYSS